MDIIKVAKPVVIIKPSELLKLAQSAADAKLIKIPYVKNQKAKSVTIIEYTTIIGFFNNSTKAENYISNHFREIIIVLLANQRIPQSWINKCPTLILLGKFQLNEKRQRNISCR